MKLHKLFCIDRCAKKKKQMINNQHLKNRADTKWRSCKKYMEKIQILEKSEKSKIRLDIKTI